MRQSLKSVMAAAALDGRLCEAMRNVQPASAAEEHTHCTDSSCITSSDKAGASDCGHSASGEMAAMPNVMPVKPTSAKTVARPSRRSSRRKEAAAGEATAAAAFCIPAEDSVRPPRLPMPLCTVAATQVENGLAPSTPSSRVGTLPPVTPPCRRKSFQAPSSMPSAMSLDLGLSRSSSSPRVAMTLDVDSDLKTASTGLTNGFSFSKTSLKTSQSFLPPISAVKAPQGIKSTAHGSAKKRTASMDSFVWGVAPVTSPQMILGSATRAVF